MDVLQATYAAMEGRELSEAEATVLLEALSRAPDDDYLRTKLCGFHFQQWSFSRNARSAATQNMFWFIEHDPTHPALTLSDWFELFMLDKSLYAQCCKHWLVAVSSHPQNAIVLKNAASFMRMEPIAYELLVRAGRLQPNSNDWQRLLEEYRSHAKQIIEDRAHPSRALDYQRGIVDSVDARFHLATRFARIDLAHCALNANALAEAELSAKIALETTDEVTYSAERDFFLHHAHTVLGRVAFLHEDIDMAEKHLIKSAENAEERSWFWLGIPLLSLASDLLSVGKQASVQAFLRGYEQLLQNRAPVLQTWVRELDAGIIPCLKPLIIDE